MASSVADGDDSFDAFLREAAHLSRGEAGASGRPLSPGQRLAAGRFEVLGRIGEGGMGVVYEAFDRQRGERVALKTLTKVGAAAVYRLKQEFRALADVRHPNLVRLHELFNDDGRWYFTMELVDRQRVDEWLRPDGSLDEARLRAGLSQLAAAVDAIHSAGKLHRDLKPANAMVDCGGRVVVLDFGLAADPEAGGVGQTVADESVSGTPAYMAPEQAAGRAVDAAADWYAVGVMLFEALTGRLPFEGRSGEILAAKQVEGAPAASSVATGVPADLERLCAALLAREPGARAGADAVRAVVGVATTGAPSQSVAPAELPALVGRDAELSALHDAYASARAAERPVVVLLSGESGIGKSALVGRFLDDLRRGEPAVVLSGRCYERESVPFKAFDAVVDELSRHLRQLGQGADALMPREVWALRKLFPVLGRIDAVAAAPERQADDAHDLRRRAFAALGELFGRIRDRGPLVLHVDDLQWSDADSTALLMHLLRQQDAPRLLCVVAHRSEGAADNPRLSPLYEHLPLDPRIDCRLLELGPLGADAARTLAGVGGETLVGEAGGNPFLLGELARAAGGASTAVTLVEALRARVAALPEAERALLEALAVSGRPTRLEVVAQAAGLSTGAHAAFEALCAAALARSSHAAGQGECYHDKVREAVAEGLSDAARARMHAALAEALLVAGDADPERVVTHLVAAGQHARAVPFAVRAAERAAAALAFERAAELYALALEAGAFEPAERHRLQVAHAQALDHAGLGVPAGEAYLAAMQGATPERALELKQRAGTLFLCAGQMVRGREVLLEVLRAHGVKAPTSTAAVVAGAAYHQGMLALGGERVRLRGPASPALRARLGVLRQAAWGLARSEQYYGAYFGARYVREALRAGDRRELPWAIAVQVFYAAQLGIRAEQMRALAARGTQIAEELGAVAAQEGLLFARAHLEWMAFNDNELGVELFDRQIALNREHVIAEASFNLAWAKSNRALIRSWGLGRFAEVAAEIPVLLDEGWARNDLCITPFLAGQHAIARVAVEHLDALEHDLARARRALDVPVYTLQEAALTHGWYTLHRYRGEPQRGLEASERGWQRLVTSPQRRMPNTASASVLGRAMGRVAVALHEPDVGAREPLLREADAILRQGATRFQPFAAFLDGARAAVMNARGDTEGAARLLRAALDLASSQAGMIRVSLEAHRRALGVMLGGDEGAALVAEADAWLRAGGAVDPARLANAFFPIEPM